MDDLLKETLAYPQVPWSVRISCAHYWVPVLLDQGKLYKSQCNKCGHVRIHETKKENNVISHSSIIKHLLTQEAEISEFKLVRQTNRQRVEDNIFLLINHIKDILYRILRKPNPNLLPYQFVLYVDPIIHRYIIDLISSELIIGSNLPVESWSDFSLSNKICICAIPLGSRELKLEDYKLVHTINLTMNDE